METGIKCSKCGKLVEGENIVKLSGRVLCFDCSKKRKRRRLLAGALIGIIAIVSCLVALRSIPKNGFVGVDEVKDEISADFQDLIFDKLKCNPINASNVGAPIEDLATFRSVFAKNVESAKEGNSDSIMIPAIAILFPLNIGILDASSESIVAEFAVAFCSTNTLGKIVVSGYTCDLGSEKINDILSRTRAVSVKESLVGSGIPEDKIMVEWFGKTKFSEFKFPSRAQYRRVVIRVQ